jgi:ATP-binding cassette, subfamily B, multidrug efflux pump
MLIDNGFSEGQNIVNISAIYKYGGILIACAILALIFGVLSGKFAAKAGAGFGKNLRHDLYYKVQEFSFKNVDKFSSASLVTRLTTDVTNVQQIFQSVIRVAIRTPLMFIFSFVMGFRISSRLSIIFLVLIPVIGVALYFLMNKIHPIMTSVFNRYDDLNNVVEENVRGIRVVKSFANEEYEKKKFETVSNDIYEKFSKAERYMALNMPVMQIGIYSCILLVSWFGAKVIVSSGATELTTGGLQSLITYGIQLLSSLMMLSFMFVMAVVSKTSVERVVEVLDEEPDLKNPKKPIYKVKDGSVEFKNVGFSYVNDENKECLKNINLRIKSGETIGIIGGTGTGKSSLVNLIPRLYDATSGEVKVGGVNAKDYDIETLRNEVAVVLQKNVLFSGTIAENIRWGNKDASDEEVERVCKLAQADDFVKSFPEKYNTYIEQGGTNVSGGQKQRLCIARALLKKPKILILDDSTSAVDTKTDSLIRKAFKEEIPNTTKFIIAQRISSVEDADKIIVMENGMVNGFGTHEELLKNNKIYKEVYESQTKGADTDEK